MLAPCLRCPKSHGGAQGRNKRRNKTKRSAHGPYQRRTSFCTSLEECWGRMENLTIHRPELSSHPGSSALHFSPKHLQPKRTKPAPPVFSFTKAKIPDAFVSWEILFLLALPYSFACSLFLLYHTPLKRWEMHHIHSHLIHHISLYQDMRQSSKKYSLPFIQTSVSYSLV